MKNKKNRLKAIVELVRTNRVGSQDELAKLLAERGHVVTQATLSRDLKQLRVTKMAAGVGGYMYVLSDSEVARNAIFTQERKAARAAGYSGFISIGYSGNMAVIKTRNGYAAGMAYDIDMRKMPEILGTIAGADTIFALLREGVDVEQAKKLFASFLPTGEP